MEITQIIESVSRSPEFAPAMQAAQAELADVPMDQLDELIKLMEVALSRPNAYPQIRAAALADDMAEPKDLPEQFDPVVLASVLAVLYRLRDGARDGSSAKARMARGGLTNVRSLASQGRLGDTMLAHISPEEAAMLKARGGAGTINPQTGLPQFFSLKKVLGAVLPIAVAIIAPQLAPAIGSALLGPSASAAAAAAAGGAVIGGVSAGLSGGNVLQGAALGGLGGGLGGMVGGGVNSALGLQLGQTGQSILGGALVGGGLGAITGQGAGKGALMGGLGAGLGQFGQGMQSPMLSAGTRAAGNMLTAGYRPQEALVGGTLAGIATSILPQGGMASNKPSDVVLNNMQRTGPFADMSQTAAQSGSSAMFDVLPATGGLDVTQSARGAPFAQQPGMALAAPEQALAPMTTSVQPAAPSGFGGNLASRLGSAAMLTSVLGAGSKPPAVQQAISQLSPEQQAFFDRPAMSWDWDRMQADAASSNMGLAQYMATNWPIISGYGMGGAQQAAYAQPQQQMARGGMAYAQGGPLSAVARFVRGGGSGRDDTIDARLSDGEYVMDAETVSMLGDGSVDEGARRLDAMRSKIRKHKGKALARGKFSPNAKQPMAYLSGVAR